MSEQKFDLVIDASEAVLGRVASYATKQSLLGKNVAIVNCSEILVTGHNRTTIDLYKEKRGRGGASLNGPNFPKSAERIVKRTIRGMVSYKQKRGRDALDRVICYNHVPAPLQDAKKVSMKTETKARTIKLGEVSREL